MSEKRVSDPTLRCPNCGGEMHFVRPKYNPDDGTTETWACDDCHRTETWLPEDELTIENFEAMWDEDEDDE